MAAELLERRCILSVCKFCGSELSEYLKELDEPYCSEECEERHVLVSRLEAAEARLARFDAMFPVVMPDDPGPITAEVCRRLSMINDAEWVAQWTVPDTDISVWCFSDGGVQVNDYYGKDITTKTAGQLMFQVAARRFGGE